MGQHLIEELMKTAMESIKEINMNSIYIRLCNYMIFFILT